MLIFYESSTRLHVVMFPTVINLRLAMKVNKTCTLQLWVHLPALQKTVCTSTNHSRSNYPNQSLTNTWITGLLCAVCNNDANTVTQIVYWCHMYILYLPAKSVLHTVEYGQWSHAYGLV